MPTLIEQRFPLGRYHATRWNQNPFEDRFGEWPPSPWRLLRALAARWFQYLRETGDDRREHRDELLAVLAANPPSFHLPSQTWPGRELRQYQPTALELQYKYKKNARTKKNELEYSFRQVSTTLAIDVYRAVPRAEALYWIWDSLDLSHESSRLLGELLKRVHYFGRAETWTCMRLMSVMDKMPGKNCVLDQAPSSKRTVPVLVHRPDRPLDIDLLLTPTEDKRLCNRRIPEGTTWFYAKLPDYVRPKMRRLPGSKQLPTQVVRYALDSTVLPLSTEALPIAEQARAYLMGTHGRIVERRTGTKGRSEVFSGKCADGHPREGHSHAFYLPTDEDGDGRLDHLTVIAEAGFDADELRALDQLRRLWRAKEAPEVNLLLLALGRCDQLSAGPLAEARTWVSSTPFLVTRHAKRNGVRRDPPELLANRRLFVEQVLKEELARFVERRGFAWAAADIQVVPLIDGQETFRVQPELWANLATGPPRRPLEFKRFRTRKRDDDGGRRLSGTFRLTFPQRIQGPVCLGHSSHFGLGLFLPAREG